ncbi:phosphopantetheine-binding protein [Deinococcus sp. QL22]|uniref:phosphopantetheine-binding protein n=1 Tax=Deinococcus sp. QL22 TaxID=2939437 RepID=UPI002016AAB7|nr:phosphopantetheine-binding protein [Deinococcus sp. QL22]UQN07959.1 phosphopantetheine-binding protein [Deinococcus sp. QL22]
MITPEQRAQLVTIIDRVTQRTQSIHDDSLLQDDLGLTSLNFIELIVEIEQDFNVTVPDEMLTADAIRSFGDLLNLISRNDTIADFTKA